MDTQTVSQQADDIRRLARERRRLKTAPTLYKTGPKRSGRDRLYAKVLKLTIETNRLAAKPATTPADRAWAERLSALLHQAVCDPL